MKCGKSSLFGNQIFIRLIVAFCILIYGEYVQAGSSLKSSIDSLLKDKKVRVGVAVRSNGQDIFSLNSQSHFPLLSVFKFYQALAVLDYLDKRQLPLSTEILIEKRDLLPNTYSPLRDDRPQEGYRLSIAELLEYSVSQSDNNACDILFRYIGGTSVADSYIRTLGIEDFKIVVTEEEMHEAFDNQYLNWTSPSAAVLLLENFRTKILFKNPVYKEFMNKIMIDAVTGKDKLKAGLPKEVVLGHKTGTSDRNSLGVKIADNDIGFVSLTDGREYTIAVFVADSHENDKINAQIISEISRMMYHHFRK